MTSAGTKFKKTNSLKFLPRRKESTQREIWRLKPTKTQCIRHFYCRQRRRYIDRRKLRQGSATCTRASRKRAHALSPEESGEERLGSLGDAHQAHGTGWAKKKSNMASTKGSKRFGQAHERMSTKRLTPVISSGTRTVLSEVAKENAE